MNNNTTPYVPSSDIIVGASRHPPRSLGALRRGRTHRRTRKCGHRRTWPRSFKNRCAHTSPEGVFWSLQSFLRE